MAERQSRSEARESAARRRLNGAAVDRNKVREALKAAGARNPDEEAVEAAAVLAEERIAEIAVRSAEASEDRAESSLSAASVALAAQRAAEEASGRRRRSER